MSQLDIVLLTGISGSGKSVALNALEDAGYFCVDNLPPELLRGLVDLEVQRPPELKRRVAVAMDVRSVHSLPHLKSVLDALRQEGLKVRSVFLDASTDTLVRRFSETRRPHPLLKLRPQSPADKPRRRASDQDHDVAQLFAVAGVHAPQEGRERLAPHFARALVDVVGDVVAEQAEHRRAADRLRRAADGEPDRQLAAHRAREIQSGSPITIDRDNDKNPVVALREIAEQTVRPKDLAEALTISLQKVVVDEDAPVEQEVFEAVGVAGSEEEEEPAGLGPEVFTEEFLHVH